MRDFIGVKVALVLGSDVLMIQRDNKPGLPFANLWDFPGGGREGNETPAECAAREMYEELEINISGRPIMWQSVHPSMIDPEHQIAHFMVVEITPQDIAAITFGDEGQGWKMMPIAEMMQSSDVVPFLPGRLGPWLQSKGQE